ncbi:M48 family metalloprotease [Flavobacterium sp. GA093]|uniref:M48 family metalloprotease n=1 Tax=Flavobacterium hydrocarbonoxydans TaxID=2683249 RepID=A0A6I4NP03_9FLAO|nr:M48 family metallopeptidase [Flavobacterium hydrocarbonoxydans]MWB96176.1 M48 family metalloprotease [Flavobacterium hydrocarbonoxydans]
MNQKTTTTVSSTFRKMTTKAILSVLLFFIVYILLILSGIGITILAGYAGFFIIVAKPMFITIMIGAGLVCMGILVLIFLFKFIFVKHTIDRSHLVEITKEQEPKLFGFIEEIVSVVKTDFPKKVYLSSDVNASVFYDSNFWSMFFPIKKNLQIGIGLINSVSEIELKAILAHEFGHFSQRSMKVGSYVYNVNQIIHNMLYDNDSYNSIAQSWGSVNGYFSFFVSLAVKIVEGIQWVLRQVYQVVNLNYYGLSRQMEFHADAVAASVTGSEPLITSLLRLDLADHSFNKVLDYYGTKIPESIATKNVYEQQTLVMNFIAHKSKVQVQNDLPQLTPDFLNRYNKSKLQIENKWDTHPSTEDRISELRKLNSKELEENTRLATSLLSNKIDLQSKFTDKMFSAVSYPSDIVYHENEDFFNEFETEFLSNSFNDIFNSYYDNKNPIFNDSEVIKTDSYADKGLNELFSNAAVDLVYNSVSLENDLNVLRQIQNGDYKIKFFNYDGHKIFRKDCSELIERLEAELKQIKEEILKNDHDIYFYFLKLANNQNKREEYKKMYNDFFIMDKDFDVNFEYYVKMIDACEFMHHVNSFEIIERNMVLLKHEEDRFKAQIEKILSNKMYSAAITIEMREVFGKYLSEDWKYFSRNEYLNEVLEILNKSVTNYQFILSKTYFQTKKELLTYKIQLLNN